jgi:superfamily II DNA or RNA helicase
MVLAHNKNLLTYLYTEIEKRNISSVGYYMGGMKDAALKNSETKTIIIATYAMASEALDIKTLTTLVLATPKTDIEQAVGRILRVKHERPLVIDIVDTHQVYQRQWAKRRKFYVKNNYKIITSNTDEYLQNVWCDDYTPTDKNVKGAKSNGAKSNGAKSNGAKSNGDGNTSNIQRGKCMVLNM